MEPLLLPIVAGPDPGVVRVVAAVAGLPADCLPPLADDVTAADARSPGVPPGSRVAAGFFSGAGFLGGSCRLGQPLRQLVVPLGRQVHRIRSPQSIQVPGGAVVLIEANVARGADNHHVFDPPPMAKIFHPAVDIGELLSHVLGVSSGAGVGEVSLVITTPVVDESWQRG